MNLAFEGQARSWVSQAFLGNEITMNSFTAKIKFRFSNQKKSDMILTNSYHVAKLNHTISLYIFLKVPMHFKKEVYFRQNH